LTPLHCDVICTSFGELNDDDDDDDDDEITTFLLEPATSVCFASF